MAWEGHMSWKSLSKREWARLREQRWTAEVAERVLAAQVADAVPQILESAGARLQRAAIRLIE